MVCEEEILKELKKSNEHLENVEKAVASLNNSQQEKSRIIAQILTYCQLINDSIIKKWFREEWEIMAEEEKYVLFKDIQENMYEINVKCVVDEMSYIVVIPREDYSESVVGHLFIHDDEYQQLRLTLWDDNTVYLESIYNCQNKAL